MREMVNAWVGKTVKQLFEGQAGSEVKGNSSRGAGLWFISGVDIRVAQASVKETEFPTSIHCSGF